MPTASPFPHYEAEVEALARRRQARLPPPGGVVFYGSSSITLWQGLEEAFPGVTVINQGFGGSTLAACVHFLPRLVTPLRPACLFVYAGENDLGDGRPVAEVLGHFRALRQALARHLPPDLLWAYGAVKPSPARRPILDRIRAYNSAVADEIATVPQARFVDLHAPMLGPSGDLRPELYEADGLHPSPACYALWRSILDPLLRTWCDQRSTAAGAIPKP